MKDMFMIRMNAWTRYDNYWAKQYAQCKAAQEAGDWESADYHLQLMEIACSLSEKKMF